MFVKKLVSFVILMAMICSIMAIPVAAQGNIQTDESLRAADPQAHAFAQAMSKDADPAADASLSTGYAGVQYLNYELNSDGTIIITGCKSAMPDEYALEIPPQIDGYPVTAIRHGAFINNAKLMAVIIPDSVVRIDDYGFTNCANLASVTIGNGLRFLGTKAFEDTPWYDGLTDEFVIVGDGLLIKYNPYGAGTTLMIPNTVKYINKDVFIEQQLIQDVTISPGVVSIGDGAFLGCSSLKRVTLPGSLTSIGEAAFYACTSLTDILFANGLKSIGSGAFSNCTSLTGITLSKGLISIGEGAFRGCALTSVTIPDGIVSIGKDAFYDCKSLINVTIGSGLKDVGEEAFKNTPWYDGFTDEFLIVSDGLLIKHNYVSPTVNVPDTVRKISSGVFSGQYEITNIMLPSSVISIGDRAFSYCSSLVKISLPEGLVSIGDEAFHYCYCLLSISLPDSLVSMGNSVFDNCQSLQNIRIGSGLKHLGSEAFKSTPWYNGLTDEFVIVGDGLLIKYNGISGEADIPNTVKHIDIAVFRERTQMRAVSIPGSVTNIEPRAFFGCTNLMSITLSEGITGIGNNAFGRCYALLSITTPESVSEIGEGAFENSGIQAAFILSKDSVKIYENAFASCGNLKGVYFYGNKPQMCPYPRKIFDYYNRPSGPLTLYYLMEKANAWAPNGETEWDGCPIAVFDPDVLPPISTPTPMPPSPTLFPTATPSEDSTPVPFPTPSPWPTETPSEKITLAKGSEYIILEGTVRIFKDRITLGEFLPNFVKPQGEFSVRHYYNQPFSDYKTIDNMDALICTGYEICLTGAPNYYGSVRDRLSIIIMGDINGDGMINSRDIAIIQGYMLTTYPFWFSGGNRLAADMNGDGIINTRDIGAIQKYMLYKAG